MIESLVKRRALAPNDEQIADQLAQLYYEQGLAWRDANRLEPAQQSFEWAVSVKPDFVAAKEEQRLAKLYLTGIEHYKKGEWARAVAVFEQVYQQNPVYLYVDEILYSAYYNLGITQEAAGQLSSALEVYRQAMEILPNAPEATLKVEEVALKLNPSTPAPLLKPVVEKRILVDISEQRAYIYENDELIYEFIISTGEPGRDTATGEFEIQSKIPMAYASTWNLDMPYWLGIYWAGPLENGFHAVPTVRDTGQTMWDGYLGQRVSYGCIILSMEDAKTLYDWADMGTPVSIRQ
jgi:tetratricopeptide (TPR) repeat protein